MTHAYDELYVEDAQRSLGTMLDYAVYCLHYELCFFFQMFLQSSYAEKFAHGDVTTISGKTGVELARNIVEEQTHEVCNVPPKYRMERSPEYWTGWALAYYQWYSGSSFLTIEREAPIDNICELYYPFHEMEIMQFVDRINEWRQAYRSMTYLKKMRVAAGLSQRQLSEKTDIPVKTIQQYEQRQKNINKAQAEYMIQLSRALHCKPEELLE